jgi:hypothetical protein
VKEVITITPPSVEINTRHLNMSVVSPCLTATFQKLAAQEVITAAFIPTLARLDASPVFRQAVTHV